MITLDLDKRGSQQVVRTVPERYGLSSWRWLDLATCAQGCRFGRAARAGVLFFLSWLGTGRILSYGRSFLTKEDTIPVNLHGKPVAS